MGLGERPFALLERTASLRPSTLTVIMPVALTFVDMLAPAAERKSLPEFC
jgi:hypothetical protein